MSKQNIEPLLKFFSSQPENATATRDEIVDVVSGPKEEADNIINWRTKRHKLIVLLGRITRKFEFPMEGDLQRKPDNQAPIPAWTIKRWEEAILLSIRK